MSRWLAAMLLVGCQSVASVPPPLRPAPPVAQAAPSPELVHASCAPTAPSHGSSQGTILPAEHRSRYDLSKGVSSLALPAGRWVVRVEAPEKSFVTIGVAGPRDALMSFEVLSRKLSRLRTGTLDSDGRLPVFVSFATRNEREVLVIVDAEKPVRVLRSHAPIYVPPKKGEKAASVADLALVGLPFPVERSAGYVMQAPHRYQFARADVAAALRDAFKQTRRRFKKNDIAIGDISQWNGIRPATDLGKARHISHQGGRDVDIGLPVQKGDSLLTRRCDGVLVENDRLECGPGTVRGVDGVRLAYFLGLLIDGPTPGGRFIKDRERRPGPIAMVETIFTDQAYIDEIRKALPELRKKRWIHDEAYSALAEEGLLRPSPWHVDHVHIRFSGAPAKTPSALDFTPEAVESAGSKQ